MSSVWDHRGIGVGVWDLEESCDGAGVWDLVGDVGVAASDVLDSCEDTEVDLDSQMHGIKQFKNCDREDHCAEEPVLYGMGEGEGVSIFDNACCDSWAVTPRVAAIQISSQDEGLRRSYQE